MKKKINLKIVLGILFVLLLGLLLFFFFTREKPEEEKPKDKESYNNSEDLMSTEKWFYGNTYYYWETNILDYYTEKLGYEPSLRDVELNDSGDLVITYKNYENKEIKIIDTVTINHLTGVITDSKGNEIDLDRHANEQGES